MKRFAFLSFLMTALALTSCEDVIDVDLDEGKPQLVVDGYVTDQPGPYTITLSKTAAYFNNAPTPRVSGAVLTITDNEGQTETLTEAEPGKYVTSTFQGKIGNHYVLEIKAEGEEYRAETDIRRIPKIDSLTQVYKPEGNGWDEGYYVLYYGPELPGRGDYYRFKVYRNDTLMNQPSDLAVRSDEFVEGNYIKGLEVNEDPFKVGDRVRAELCSITEDNFYFYNEMFTQVNNGGIFANPPANVRTNIINRKADGKKAAGYFGGMAVRSKTLVVNETK